MTRSQKFVFVALGAVLILFAGSVMLRQDHADCKGREEACADEYKQSIQRVSSLFSSSGSRIELPQSSYTIEPKDTREVAVPEGSESVRTLKLRLESGQKIELKYVNKLQGTDPIPVEQPEPASSPQSLPRIAQDQADRDQVSFVVTKKGGTVTMTCLGQIRCVVVPN